MGPGDAGRGPDPQEGRDTDTELDARVLHAPDAADGTPTLILMHGRGADPSDLAPLRSRLPDRWTVVLPRAPHPGLPWGYGPGWAWYRYEGDDRPEVESFRVSQATLDRLLASLGDRLAYVPGPVVLGGFSQGGTMALGRAIRDRSGIAGVLVFSGFLPSHPDVEPGKAGGLRVWWGHGTRDPAVPHTLAVRGRAALREAGAELEVRDYPMGHGISPTELEDAAAWLEDRLDADD